MAATNWPTFQVDRCAERNWSQLPPGRDVDLQDREVFVRCDTNQLGPNDRIVVEYDRGRIGILHDVEVGHDVTLLVPDKTGPPFQRGSHSAGLTREPIDRFGWL